MVKQKRVKKQKKEIPDEGQEVREIKEVNIDGEPCVIIKKDLGMGFISTTITSKHTYTNFYNSTDNAKMLDYESIKNYVKLHFSELTSPTANYEIQVLSRDRWHSNKARLWKPDINEHEFFDDRHFNISGEDGEVLDLSEIFAIQILQMPEK